MSSLSRTIARHGNPEYFKKRPGGGLKQHSHHSLPQDIARRRKVNKIARRSRRINRNP